MSHLTEHCLTHVGALMENNEETGITKLRQPKQKTGLSVSLSIEKWCVCMYVLL